MAQDTEVVEKEGPAYRNMRKMVMPMGDHLTPEQEAFCRARATGMTLREAATACGLKPPACAKWEQKIPAIPKRIAELSALATENAIIKSGLNREWVINRLMSVVDRCMQAEPVRDRKGEPTGEYQFDSSGANAALRMLGDTMGMFRPAEKKPEDEYANLSDDDIARIVGELAAQTGLASAIAGIAAPAEPQQVIEVQAVPAPDRVPQQGGEIPGEAVPGG